MAGGCCREHRRPGCRTGRRRRRRDAWCWCGRLCPGCRRAFQRSLMWTVSPDEWGPHATQAPTVCRSNSRPIVVDENRSCVALHRLEGGRGNRRAARARYRSLARRPSQIPNLSCRREVGPPPGDFIADPAGSYSSAEGVGFEPTVGFPTPVFKTGALGHYASPPRRCTNREHHGQRPVERIVVDAPSRAEPSVARQPRNEKPS